jgi:hypothetical protein
MRKDIVCGSSINRRDHSRTDIASASPSAPYLFLLASGILSIAFRAFCPLRVTFARLSRTFFGTIFCGSFSFGCGGGESFRFCLLEAAVGVENNGVAGISDPLRVESSRTSWRSSIGVTGAGEGGPGVNLRGTIGVWNIPSPVAKLACRRVVGVDGTF